MHSFGKANGLAMKLVAAFLIFSACLPGAARADTDMKQLKSIMIAPAAPGHENLAAKILKTNLEKMYGIALPVKALDRKAAAEVGQAVLVGQAAVHAGIITKAELAKVKYDGFVLKVKNGTVAVAGFLPRGSIYGAYRFLERLGYRWFAAGCERIPKPANSVIADTEVSEKPTLEYRSGRGWQLKLSVGALGDPRRGLNPEIFKGGRLWVDHTAGYLVPKKMYYDKHPEYYALMTTGKRIPKTTSDAYIHLCLSNPDVVRISIERALGWMRLQPEQRFFCIVQGDGSQWCQCDKCKAMDVQHGNYADRLLKWVNAVARAAQKEFPDNIVLAGAYCGTDSAPVKERPEKNVRVMYAPYWGVALSEVHPLTHPANEEALKQLEAWLRVAPDQMYIYDYNMYYCPSWDAMAEKIKWYADKGIGGIWFCGAPTCFRNMFQYINRNLTWNAYQDPEKLKKEFVEAYYGAAAPYVMEYLASVKKRLSRGFPRGIHDRCMPPGYYGDGTIQRQLALFDKMAEAAAGDRKVLGRILSERKMIVEDYTVSVRCNKRDLPRADRRYAINTFKKYLQESIDRDVSLGSHPSNKKLREKNTASIAARLRWCAGIAVPKTSSPVDVAKAFIQDPEGVMKKYAAKPGYPKTAPEKLPNGVRLLATCFEGGHGPARDAWMCEPRVGMAIYSSRSPRASAMKAEFDLDETPRTGAVLKFEGNGGDKDLVPATHVAILLNDKEIFSGPVEVIRRGWSWQTVRIPDGVLRKGRNVLEFKNIMKSARLDHYWFEVSEAQIIFQKLGRD